MEAGREAGAPPTAVASVLRHPAFEADRAAGVPLAEAELTDRGRLAVVLEGAALLAHLEHAGWRLAAGWRDARVSADGRLAAGGGVPGRERRPAPASLRLLLARLFGGERVAGRGEARRAARRLLQRWAWTPAPVAADRALTAVLEAAPFLWSPAFGAARASLAAEHRPGEGDGGPDGGGSYLWIAGPGHFRRRMLARAESLEAAWDVLADGHARELWQGLPAGAGADPEALAAAGRWRAAAAAWERQLENGSGSAAAARTGLADALAGQGRFEDALERLAGLRSVDAALLRARCQLHLARLGAARRTVERLAQRKLEPAQAVELAAIGGRLAANRGERGGPRRWSKRALAAGRRGNAGVAARGELVAALAAWDRGEGEEAARRLEASAALADDPDHGWRWLQARALTALAEGDPREAAASLARALRGSRRRLHRHRAAGLWNDLGLARAHAGDLAGAERAFLHSHRLYRGCDGPRQLTLAAVNLAEIRLRRGRLAGVDAILERSTAANRADGNQRGAAYDAALWARWELVHGRPDAALTLCREALSELERAGLEAHREELRLLAARALGWLDRPEEASDELSGVDPAALACLEPEERPALFALAGERERALEAAAGTPLTTLFSAVLIGAEPPVEAWRPLGDLEPYRAARLIDDCDRLAPGVVPLPWLRRAAATLRRVGAGRPAERLEARDAGAWQALAAYLGRRPGDPEALSTLFTAAGYPEVRLVWSADDGGDDRVLVAGDGGAERLTAPAAGGTLELMAPAVDGALSALFRLARRDLPAPSGPVSTGVTVRGEGASGAAADASGAGGIVGRSPALLTALERADRLAAGELPVLIRGESGTGKELVARRLHRRSARRDGPLVPINCAALSESLLLSDLFGHVRGAFTGADRDRAGVFESARGGTVFLDEIGDLPAHAQGMLLRVLQEGEVRRVGESLARQVDVRVLAASHRDLGAMAREGSFRQDLYYRLRGAVVTLPPLRDRGADVLLLAEHLLAERAAPEPAPRLSPAARERLLAHRWPGNVRELDHTLGVAAALAAGEVIEPEHLELPTDGPAPAGDYHRRVEDYRRRLLADALEASDGNRAEAARQLGLSRQALSYLVRKLGLI